MSEGVFCLIHFDEEELIDSGPTPSAISLIGHAIHDPLDGAFSDPLGCVSFPQQLDGNGDLLPPEEYPVAELRKVTALRELEFDNDSFVVEMQIKFSSLTGLQRLASYRSPVPVLAWAITANFTQSNQTVDFLWSDHHGDTNRNFSVTLSTDPFTEETWQHFVFQYDKVSEYISVWVDGNLVGSFFGPDLDDSQQRSWDGIYIQDMSENGQPRYFSVGGPEDTFKGAIDEIKVVTGYSSYESLAETIPVPTAPYEYIDSSPELEPLDSIEINRAMVNNIPKTYVEEPRHTPALVRVYTEAPSETSLRSAHNEGAVYAHRPRPDYPIVFLYVRYNIQGEGETPILRWVPVSMPKLGEENLTTGTSWKNRKGFKLGEPF